jgi:hypothetical protein
MRLKCENTDDEKQFCREIFAAMYEATANTVIPSKLVYPYDFKTANGRSETSYYHKNRDMTNDCAKAIDAAIEASCYKTNYYNLELAAMVAISAQGFERVNHILANQIQKHESDRRYSDDNRKWANGVTIPEARSYLRSHAILIDDFVKYARKLYEDTGAERFALPGKEEQSEDVNGYAIIRSIMVDANQGYAIGHNPDAVSPWVCWQFYIREGERSYNWGIYGDEQAAIDGYNARLFVKYN